MPVIHLKEFFLILCTRLYRSMYRAYRVGICIRGADASASDHVPARVRKTLL